MRQQNEFLESQNPQNDKKYQQLTFRLPRIVQKQQQVSSDRLKNIYKVVENSNKIKETHHINEFIEEQVQDKVEEQKVTTKIDRYNQLNSLPITQMKTVNQRMKTEPQKPAKSHKKINKIIESINKYQLVLKDKLQNPLKYKILGQQLGYNQEEVFKMQDKEVKALKQKYAKQKGKDYLRQNSLLAHLQKHRRMQRAKTQANHNDLSKVNQNQLSKASSAKTLKQRNCIHEVFGRQAFLLKQKQLRKQKQQRKKNSLIKVLRERQHYLGHIVFTKVKRHLHTQQSKNNYYHRVKGQASIDKAMIAFLHNKIKRVQVNLHHNKK